MLQKDPSQRRQASQYLEKQKGKSFPEYFSSFLHSYLVKFASMPILAADERLNHLQNDLPAIIDQLQPHSPSEEDLRQSGTKQVLTEKPKDSDTGTKRAEESVSSEKDICVETDQEAFKLIIPLITSCVHGLHLECSKIAAIDMLVDLSERVPSPVVLDRIVPYILHFVNDPVGHVRAHAVRTITGCLVAIKSVPLSDSNIFPEYILPQVSEKTYLL